MHFIIYILCLLIQFTSVLWCYHLIFVIFGESLLVNLHT